ncbi:unnamed protein product [Lymnaea stagnalis]|uniref:Rho-GAP domain-containing protein n=1 Tax=Lymnaea stagnalis TaxID=6523 RepID=A0AAV2IEH3_LYMST
MANMMFLFRQRAAALPTRQLTTVASSRSLLQKILFSDKVLVRQTLSHLQAENVLKSLKFISSTSGQLNNKILVEDVFKFSSEDVSKATKTPSPSNWLPSYNQKGSLFYGLFGYGRQDVPTYANHRPLSYNCRGLHLVPARYCNIPTDFKAKPFTNLPQGTTIISDLCKESQSRLREIAYSNMKRFLHDNGITYVKNKPKKYSDQGLFKSAFQVQVEKDIAHKRNINRVPALLRYLIMEIAQRDLDTAGIFRKPGRAAQIKELKADLEKNFYQSGQIDRSNHNIHTFASVLKEFLRDPPAKLISTENFEIYPPIEGLPFKAKQYTFMRYFFVGMTPEHRETLQFLFSFLDEVASRSSKNGMTHDNLAICFAPNLFNIGDVPPDQQGEKSKTLVNMTRAWMFYYHDLGIVTGRLMGDLRRSFETKPAKIKFDPKLFPEVPKPPPVPSNLLGLTSTTMTVMTPYETQSSQQVDIDQNVTAHHVVCKVLGIHYDPFDIVPINPASDPSTPIGPEVLYDMKPSEYNEKSSNDESGKPFYYLYEVGGNIGERRLNPNTIMLELYQKNPNAVWILKPYGKPPTDVSK